MKSVSHAAAADQLPNDTFSVFEAASLNFVTKSREDTRILPYNITVAKVVVLMPHFSLSLAPMQVQWQGRGVIQRIFTASLNHTGSVESLATAHHGEAQEAEGRRKTV